jgi:hypothetical protein
VLDIAEQDERIRFCRVNYFVQALKSPLGPALEVQAMSGQVSLDPEMEVRHNEHTLIAFDDKCRALPDKFHLHNGLTNPFWGW